MIALPLTLSQSAIAVLCTTLGLLVLFIAYRKLLSYLGKGKKVVVKYHNLYPVVADAVQGELIFFYEAEEKIDTVLTLLDKDWNEIRVLDQRESKVGGNKILFDTTSVPNGTYFYQIKTDKQTDSKRFKVENPV